MLILFCQPAEHVSQALTQELSSLKGKSLTPFQLLPPPFFQTPPLFTFLFRLRVSWLLLRNNDNGKCKGCLPVKTKIFQGHIISTYTNGSIFTVMKMNLQEREGEKAR